MHGPRPLTLAALDTWVTAVRRTAWGECAFLLAVVVGIVQALRCVGGALMWPEPTDFAAFVHNARTWLAHQPYALVRDPNAPHVIALFSVFLPFSLRTAMASWLMVSAVAACASLSVMRWATAVAPSGQVTAVLLSLFLASPPVGDMLVDGNMTWALWLPFTVAWASARQGRSTQAGVLMGVLMTAKPFLALWLVYFVVRRMWLALAGAVLACGVTYLCALLVTGPEVWLAWFETLRQINWYDGAQNAGVAGLVARTAGVDTWLWTACALSLAVATVVSMGRRAPNVDLDWTVTLLASLLMAPLGWRYYFCWALGPLTGHLQANPPTPALAGLLLLWAFTPAVSSPEWSGLTRATIGSAVFWTTLAVWALLQRRRGPCANFSSQ